MIYGIGIDIVAVQRLRDAYERWGMRFFERIYTSREMDYCFSKKDPFPSLAVRFAAKEALVKATGGEIAFNFRDMETLNSERGRPYMVFGGKVKSFLDARRVKECHISLSHEKEYGIAFVLLEA
jgi:holo-[acyl-carrier protein] synthase